MKNVKALFVAAVLSSLSFADFVAVKVQPTLAGQEKAGIVSTNVGASLGFLEDRLAQEADGIGTKSLRITSVTDPNTLRGTAVIYR